MSEKSHIYQSTGPKQTYTGSCHCGAVKYEVQHDDLEKSGVVCCNCTYCSINGCLMIHPPVDDFKLISGEDVLKSHKFGKQPISQKFCGNCGTSVFADASAKGIYAVNTRTFKDVDAGKLRQKPFAGLTKF